MTLKCPNCKRTDLTIVGFIEDVETLVCDYCGAEFEWDGELVEVINEGIKTFHGIFFIRLFVTRNSFFNWKNKKKTMRKIDIPVDFKHYLRDLKDRWRWGYDVTAIPFTIGLDQKSGIMSLAVVHPKDHFDRSIGNKIVTGRLKRMLGEIPGREPYDPIPEYIYIPK